MMTVSPDTPQFLVSETAATRIASLLKTEPDGSRLRISVEGGGCSGFQYHFDFDSTTPATDDHVFSENGVEVVIDDLSLSFIGGGMIDFVDKLGASYFQITNPNSTASCGCGNSFAV
jgi:iron-sulfur cluster insertion protein